MLQFDASDRDERFAVWQDVELLKRVAAKGGPFSTVREAVKIRETDRKPSANFHELCFGAFPELRAEAGYAFDRIRTECNLPEFSDWHKQREWLESMFRAFFKRNDGLGWFSILSARRPAKHRGMEDSTLDFTQRKATVQRRWRLANQGGRHSIGGIKIPMAGLHWASHPDAPKEDARLTKVIVPRRVSSSRFSVGDGYYEEHWYTLSQPTGDDKSLEQGRIPALGSLPYEKEAFSLRETIFLSFISVSLSSPPWQSVLGVEIYPVTGEVLSLRWDRSPLAVALLNDEPVEHRAISEILRKGSG